MNFVVGSMLKAKLEVFAKESEEIDIAVAWIGPSTALSAILAAGQNRSCKVRIVTGVGGYLTQPDVLRKIAKTVDLKIYGDPEGALYHPKLYIFRKGYRRTVWAGSANLTQSAMSTNTESVFEFQDSLGISKQEFERFWESTLAVPFTEWDVNAYEAERTTRDQQLRGILGRGVLPDEEFEPKNNEFDILASEWKDYVAELRSIGESNPDQFRLANWLRVLDSRNQLVERDWELDLTETELAIMYGKQEFAPFGRLNPIMQGRFLGPDGKRRRRLLGEALREAARMKRFQEPIVQKVFENLCGADGCGPALASRLLSLARPDIFVVVNKKSFQGLAERFQVPVPRDISPKLYAELLRKIQEQPWCQSQQPSDPSDIRIWENRAALIDPLVYRETPDSLDD